MSYAGEYCFGRGTSFEIYPITKNSIMKTSLSAIMLLALTSMLSSSEAIGTIFEAGVWTGVLVVALVVGLIIFIIAKMGKKN